MREDFVIQAECFNDAQEIEIEPEVHVFRTKDDDTPGILLAQYIQGQMAKSGINMEGPFNRSDFAWELYYLDNEKQTLIVSCGYMGDGDWLIEVAFYRPILKRIFGGRVVAKLYFKTFCKRLNELFSQDDRFLIKS